MNNTIPSEQVSTASVKPELQRDLSLNTLKTNEQQLREEIEALRRETQELTEKDEELKQDIEKIHEKITTAED
ncbi:hypothetical protein BD770DRAFT_247071 [Pilaira anomala]|nr:hypothetical protein BD770DRAFT_247071 [Pilaira anomala]